MVSRDGDQATLRMTAPDEEPEDVQLTRVEGRWVPSEMAADWDVKVAAAKEKARYDYDEELAQGKVQAMVLIGHGRCDAEASSRRSNRPRSSTRSSRVCSAPLLGGLMQPGAAEMVVADPADS